MRATIFALVIVPAVFALDGIKLWITNNRCYATTDNKYGCRNSCNQYQARHVFFDEANWKDTAHFGRFTDPRADKDKWLNIWPENGQTWGVFVDGGDGKKIGLCERVDDKNCECGPDNQVKTKTASYAYCQMYV